MTDLIGFLRARLDEDERVAREAGDAGPAGAALFVIDDDYRHGTVAIPAARVLADVDAKRRIIELHREETLPYDVSTGRCYECNNEAIPCPTLRVLALPYADHPDYREEWRP